MCSLSTFLKIMFSTIWELHFGIVCSLRKLSQGSDVPSGTDYRPPHLAEQEGGEQETHWFSQD